MIDPEKIYEKFNISPLGAPPSSGVYSVVIFDISPKKETILYIGSSKNIQKRVSSKTHPYKRIFDSLYGGDLLCCVKYYECDEYLEIEKELIRKFNPTFNRQWARVLK